MKIYISDSSTEGNEWVCTYDLSTMEIVWRDGVDKTDKQKKEFAHQLIKNLGNV